MICQDAFHRRRWLSMPIKSNLNAKNKYSNNVRLGLQHIVLTNRIRSKAPNFIGLNSLIYHS